MRRTRNALPASRATPRFRIKAIACCLARAKIAETMPAVLARAPEGWDHGRGATRTRARQFRLGWTETRHHVSVVGASAAGHGGQAPQGGLFEANQGAGVRAGTARRFLHAIEFFVSRGHYLLLSTLVILVALGLVLFFVKTSALAPLIYLLF